MNRITGPLVLFCLVGVPVFATTFTDTTFNLSDYSFITFQSGSGTINVFQTTSLGNSSPALEIDTTIPSGSFSSYEYFLNPAFIYNPAIQGPVSSINFSQDVDDFATGAALFEEVVYPLIFQDGNFYLSDILLPRAGIFGRAAEDEIMASQFVLITNLATGAFDRTQHPDFFGGALEIGFAGEWTTTPVPFSYTGTQLYDNLSITLNPATPEPKTLRLMIAAILMLALWRIVAQLPSQLANLFSVGSYSSSRMPEIDRPDAIEVVQNDSSATLAQQSNSHLPKF